MSLVHFLLCLPRLRTPSILPSNNCFCFPSPLMTWPKRSLVYNITFVGRQSYICPRIGGVFGSGPDYKMLQRPSIASSAIKYFVALWRVHVVLECNKVVRFSVQFIATNSRTLVSLCFVEPGPFSTLVGLDPEKEELKVGGTRYEARSRGRSSPETFWACETRKRQSTTARSAVSSYANTRY